MSVPWNCLQDRLCLERGSSDSGDHGDRVRQDRVAARSAEKLRAGRVLVLVPSLDLLTQTEAAWRVAAVRALMIGVSALRGEDVTFPNTTDVDELVDWVRPFDKVTVFATYASLGLGTLERAPGRPSGLGPDRGR
ncbi:hypothetical protein GCM10020256_74920 [Streptomyces thermocoprophilus]